MKKLLLIGPLLALLAVANAQNKSHLEATNRLKLVNKPVQGEDQINSRLAVIDAKMQAVQADILKAQSDLADLRAAQDAIKSQLNSMNEMSEMTSMRLQMAMDRRSKFMEALSNMMKKIGDTQEAITQNLK